MDKLLAQRVRERAGQACEYCLMPQALSDVRFPIDHIIAQQHRGPTRLENLAQSCLSCNRSKGPNIAGIDPASGQLTRLFHPRRDRWPDHFAWSGAVLVGLTDVGRTTVEVLAINDPLYVAVRELLILEGLFPPTRS